MNVKLRAEDLAHFTGTENWYRHGLMRNVLFTNGIKYLATKGECFWLIDKIASLQLLPTIRAEDFQVWRLMVVGNGATLTCEDGNNIVVHAEQITFTDFPLDEVTIWVEGSVILLPSEH